MKKERDLIAIAGSTLVYQVRILRNRRRAHFMKAYSVEFMISRYNQHNSIISVTGVFSGSQQNFKLTIPSELTRPLSGNYIYQIKVTTPNGFVVIKNYGHLFVHQFAGGGS